MLAIIFNYLVIIELYLFLFVLFHTYNFTLGVLSILLTHTYMYHKVDINRHHLLL